jgi:hypothetical protein
MLKFVLNVGIFVKYSGIVDATWGERGDRTMVMWERW